MFQLQGQDLQAALELEHSNLQEALHKASHLRTELRDAEQVLEW